MQWPPTRYGEKSRKFQFGAGSVENVVGGEPERAEYLRHLVDEGDVDVALGVFDHLGGIGGANVAGDEHLAPIKKAQFANCVH